jgi:hypothetical protein
MRLNRLDLPVPALPTTLSATADAAQLDARTQQALIKLLGRAIDLVGEAETRALAPALVAYLARPPYELGL